MSQLPNSNYAELEPRQNKRQRRRNRKKGGSDRNPQQQNSDSHQSQPQQKLQYQQKRHYAPKQQQAPAKDASPQIDRSEVKNDDSSVDDLIMIDGSILEGGGQIIRNCVALSALLHKPVKIHKIRAGRSKPGLRAQHLQGINLVQKIYGGSLIGNQLNSTEITYYPKGHSYQSNFTVDTGTAGSVCLLLQIALPCLLFSPTPTQLILRGGTNASFAPQIDYSIHVLQPMLKRLMNIDINIVCRRRGFFPKGGGEVSVSVKPVPTFLSSFKLIEKGRLTSIKGIAVVSKLPVSVATEMAQGATQTLLKTFERDRIPIEIDVSKEDSFGFGSAIVVYGDTNTGCLFGGSALGGAGGGGKKGGRGGKRGGGGKMDNKSIGNAAANEFIEDFNSGGVNGCTDQWLQDQLILFMALAKGKSVMKTRAVQLHTKTAIHFAELMTGAKFTVTEHMYNPNDKKRDCTATIECEGIGLTNQFISEE